MREQTVELAWVFRPFEGRPANVQALAGIPVHAAGPMKMDGAEVVLRDGSRVQAMRAGLSAE
ncbi:hypothetical protein [Actinoplanes sp. NPDC026623]|uniref:hypothetical protein n=1 Tax=Actinoplanes sp. NPDC026623 TaxID=3155610 RepID=UPI0033C75C79